MNRLQAVTDSVASALNGQSTSVSRRVRRELDQRVTAVQADGLVASTRIEMGGFVTAVAMHHVGMASEREARLSARSPLSVARNQLLVDSLTALAANEIDALSTKWRFGR